MENNYQLSRIHNYVNGLMGREEMHALEREALNDPFLQDAIDGYRLQNGVDTKQLSLLQQQLAKRIEVKSDSRDKQFFGWQRLAIGLTAAVLFVSVCILMLMRYLPQQTELKLQEVQMMNVQLEIHSTADAEPIAGWEVFKSSLLFSEVNLENFQGKKLVIQGDVDAEGRAQNLSIIADTDRGLDLEEYLLNEVKWKGNQINFTINVK